jgi:hypothetical protein
MEGTMTQKRARTQDNDEGMRDRERTMRKRRRGTMMRTNGYTDAGPQTGCEG